MIENRGDNEHCDDEDEAGQAVKPRLACGKQLVMRSFLNWISEAPVISPDGRHVALLDWAGARPNSRPHCPVDRFNIRGAKRRKKTKKMRDTGNVNTETNQTTKAGRSKREDRLAPQLGRCPSKFQALLPG